MSNPEQSPTRHVQTLLDAARALGGQVETSRESACYTSTCSYGTPSYRSFYSPEEKRWVRQGPELDVTVHRVSWSLAEVPGRPWERHATGPTAFELAREAKLDSAWTEQAGGPHDQRKDEGITQLVLYEHDTLTAANGSEGRGIVVATTARISTASQTDQRGAWHFRTDAQGNLHLGMFAI